MTTKLDASKMEYRYLDPTGLTVLVVSFDILVDNASNQLKVDSVKFFL